MEQQHRSDPRSASLLSAGHPLRMAAAVIVLTVVGLLRLAPAVTSTPFHRDEARWIGNSALLAEWRHPLGARWQDEGYRNRYGTIDESNRRRSQPPLAMYLIGIGLLLQGEGLQDTGYWIMERDAEWNAAHGNSPSQSELGAARRTNVALAIATAIVIFLIGSSLVNTVAGLLAGMFYVMHPLVLSTSTRAWSDPTLALCIAIAGYASLHYGRRPTLARALLMGVCLGLGAASKLSPLIIAVGIGALAVIPILAAALRTIEPRDALRAALQLIVVPISAFMSFVALYPYLWKDPFGNINRMFDFRSTSFDLQRSAFPPARVAGFADALGRIEVQLADRFSLSGYLAGRITDLFDVSPPKWSGDIDLVLAGAGFLLLVTLAAHRRFPIDTVMVTAVLGGQAALIVATYRLDYSRYLLPILPLMSIAFAAAIAVPGAGLFARFKTRDECADRRAGNAPQGDVVME